MARATPPQLQPLPGVVLPAYGNLVCGAYDTLCRRCYHWGLRARRFRPQSMVCIMDLAGWKTALDKSPPASILFSVIGEVLDLRTVPDEGAAEAMTLKRVHVSTVFIKNVLREGRLSSGDAASLSGKIGVYNYRGVRQNWSSTARSQCCRGTLSAACVGGSAT